MRGTPSELQQVETLDDAGQRLHCVALVEFGEVVDYRPQQRPQVLLNVFPAELHALTRRGGHAELLQHSVRTLQPPVRRPCGRVVEHKALLGAELQQRTLKVRQLLVVFKLHHSELEQRRLSKGKPHARTSSPAPERHGHGHRRLLAESTVQHILELLDVTGRCAPHKLPATSLSFGGVHLHAHLADHEKLPYHRLELDPAPHSYVLERHAPGSPVPGAQGVPRLEVHVCEELRVFPVCRVESLSVEEAHHRG